MPGFASFILFVALCASAAYWFLQFWRPPVRPMAAPVAAVANEVPLDTAAGLFGGRPAAVGVASNYQLRGVVVAANGRESVAILSADGKPAQAVGVDTEFQPGVTVREVHPQYVLLSENGVVKRVALPEGARSSTADLIPGMAPGMAASAPSMPAQQPMPMQALPQFQPQMTPQLQVPPQNQVQPAMQPSTQPQPMPQTQPQAGNGAGGIGSVPAMQMSTQMAAPVQGQVNALGQQAVPGGMPPAIPTPSRRQQSPDR